MNLSQLSYLGLELALEMISRENCTWGELIDWKMLSKLLKIMRRSKDHPWLEDLNLLDPITQTLDLIQPTKANPLLINLDPTQTQIGQTRLLVGRTLIIPIPTLTPLILTLVQASPVLAVL